MSLYPDKISIVARTTTSRDANGQPVEETPDKHVNIPASVQRNRATSGSNNNQRHDRGTPEQPSTIDVYTTIDVSDVEPDDILIHHDHRGDKRYGVMLVTNMAGRGSHWRIEVSSL